MSAKHITSDGIERKPCAKCREALPLLHYSGDRCRADGLSDRCRPCDNAMKAERRHGRLLRSGKMRIGCTGGQLHHWIVAAESDRREKELVPL